MSVVTFDARANPVSIDEQIVHVLSPLGKMMAAPTFKSSASVFKPPSGQLSIMEVRNRATVGDRVQVRTRTSNYVFPMTIGPQLAWPSGPVRPYVNAGVGAQAFVTESDVEGVDDLFVIARSTNQSDATLVWVAGGGITVPIVRGATRAQLDLSMQYINGGRARYLAPGSIIDLQGGEVRISSLESTTHLVMLRVGARIGL